MPSQTIHPQSHKLAMAHLPPNTQPKYFSQQAILNLCGFQNMHTFMRSQRLRFSNYAHYHRAQVMIEEFRQKLQLHWEEGQRIRRAELETITAISAKQTEKKKGMEQALAEESELLRLGEKWEDFGTLGREKPRNVGMRDEKRKEEGEEKKKGRKGQCEGTQMQKYLDSLTAEFEEMVH